LLGGGTATTGTEGDGDFTVGSFDLVSSTFSAVFAFGGVEAAAVGAVPDLAAFVGAGAAGAVGAAAGHEDVLEDPPVVPEVLPAVFAVPDEVRVTLVGDSGTSVDRSVLDSGVPLSVVAGVSTRGSSASVGAPAAPDLACVSVIDQSCSLGSSPSYTALVLLFRFVRVACDSDQGHAVRQVHQLDPHCVPVTRPSYGLHRSADYATI